jgi:hypothetical protein
MTKDNQKYQYAFDIVERDISAKGKRGDIAAEEYIKNTSS